MPFNHKKRYAAFKKKPFYKKVISVAQTASTALRIAQGLASLINVEKKHHDKLFTMNPNIAVGRIEFLSAIAQGTTDTSRVGDSILPKLLSVKMQLNQHATATDTKIRIIFFIDKDHDGVAPVGPDLLANQDVLSFYNLDDISRFRILSDRVYTLKPDTEVKYLHFNFRFNNPKRTNKVNNKWYHIKYSGPTANIEDLEGGQLMSYIISDQVTNTPTITMRTRIRYIDN